MRGSHFVFAGALAIAGYAVFQSVAADQRQMVVAAATTQAPEPVAVGTYQPFNVVQMIRLSATTLVNPKAAETAALAYGFEASEVMLAGGMAEVAGKLAAGSVRFGQTVAAGNISLVRVDDKTAKEFEELLKSQPASAKPNPNGKWKFLATSAVLAGVPASGEWIAWEPDPKK